MFRLRLLVILLSLFRSSTPTCYLPNGTAHDDEGTQPCSFDIASPFHTTCCHGKWGSAPGGDVKFGTTRDECLPNGLCQNRGMSTIVGQEQAPWTHFYRVYCTNSDWSGCLSVCDTGLNADDVVQLTPCDGTNTSDKWCCGATTDCCSAENSHRAVSIPRQLGSTSPTPSPTPSSTSSLPYTSSSMVAGHPRPEKKKQRNLGVGIGVGLGVPIVLVLGAVLAACLARRIQMPAIDASASQGDVIEIKVVQVGVEELQAPDVELQAGRMEVELP